MPWVKVDDGFFDHPKMRSAGRNGRSLLVAGLCHASGQLTDGLIRDSDLALVAAKAEVPAKATAARLVEVHAWHRAGHDCPACPPCPDGAFLIHEYHAYQPSAEQERERRRQVSEVKARAGRAGAAKRWQNHGTTDGTAIAEPMAQPWQEGGTGHGTAIAQAWHSDSPEPEPEPEPEPPGVTSVVHSRSTRTPANERAETLRAAADLIGERASLGPNVRNPAAMRRSVARGVVADRYAEAYQLLAADPAMTPAVLADRLDPGPKPGPRLPLVSEVLSDEPADWDGGAVGVAGIRADLGLVKAPPEAVVGEP